MLFVISTTILLIWLLCSLVMIGIGSLIMNLFHARQRLDANLWFGLSVCIGILELYHLARPIDHIVAILIVSFGALGLLRNHWDLICEIKAANRSVMVVAILFVFCIAIRAAGPCELYDTGLYGASMVRWNLTYPVVPGLANLHGRLGFGSSIYLFAAFVEQSGLRGLSDHLVTGFVIAALSVSIIFAAFRLFTGASVLAVDWFSSILIIPTVSWAVHGSIAGTDNDLIAAAVCLTAFTALFRALEAKRTSGDYGTELLLATTLFCLAISIKLSNVVLAGLGWVVAFAALWIFARQSRDGRPLITASIAFSALILVPWFIRGIIVTGYPFYPTTSFALPVDWRVPFGTANWLTAWIRSWARSPAPVLVDSGNFHWLKPWINTSSTEREAFQVPLAFYVAGVALYLFSGGMRRLKRSDWRLLLVPSTAGLLFWFFEAPDLRFGESAIWTTAAVLATLGFASILHGSTLTARRMAIMFLLGVGVWCIHPGGAWQVYKPLLSVHSFLRLPAVHLIQRRTDSGLIVNLPAAENDQCWDAPLPCTPDFNNTLRLRRPNELKSGFRSEALDIPISCPLNTTREHIPGCS